VLLAYNLGLYPSAEAFNPRFKREHAWSTAMQG